MLSSKANRFPVLVNEHVAIVVHKKIGTMPVAEGHHSKTPNCNAKLPKNKNVG